MRFRTTTINITVITFFLLLLATPALCSREGGDSATSRDKVPSGAESRASRKHRTIALPIKKYAFNNGLTLITHDIKEAPVLSLQVWFQVGSRNETEQNSGISHFIEHLLFKGSKKYPDPGEMEKVMESLGGNFNAGTSKDYTNYHVTLPKTGFAKALEILASEVTEPLFLAEEIDRERKVVLEEIARHRDNVDSELFDQLYQLAYRSHPYRLPTLGTAKTLATLSRKDILAYYQTHYGPSHCTVVIAGDLDGLPLPHAVETLFSPFQNPQAEHVLLSDTIPKEASIPRKRNEQILEKSIALERLAIGYLGPEGIHPDSYPADVLATLLGSGRSARLFQNLKEKKQLVLDIDMSFVTQHDPGLFIVSTSQKPGNRKTIVAAIEAELHRIQKEGVSPTELNKAKILLKSHWVREHETPDGSASTLGYFASVTNLNYDLGYLAAIEKVTPKQIKRVAKKYLTAPSILYFKTNQDGSK